MTKLLINSITVNPELSEDQLGDIIKTRYSINGDFTFAIHRKSLDARNKNNIFYRYRIIIEIADDAAERLCSFPEISLYTIQRNKPSFRNGKGIHPIVIGSGPASLFFALRIIESGGQVTILEQGKTTHERIKDINLLENEGRLNPFSNVVFGEGGAGTYSDGKLTTRIHREEIDWFYDQLIKFDAPQQIRYEAKPHIGTDRLVPILEKIRRYIMASGSTILFDSGVMDFIREGNRIIGAITADGREFRSNMIILATGHSAREIYPMIRKHGAALEKKGFAVGFRIEHPSEYINFIQYGRMALKKVLPAADYHLAFNDRNTGRGIYSFCMCPGGRVINASSESGRLCVNGMSLSKRDSVYSNAAIVVSVRPDDLGDSPLAGIDFQRKIEERCFAAGGGGFCAPAQRVTSFIQGRLDSNLPAGSYLPGIVPGSMGSVFPDFVSDGLKQGLLMFNTKMRGFIDPNAIVIGSETRTSSPVRIVRDESFQSTTLKGLYPIGEGSGYSGGIVSSAVDGIRCADTILEQFQ